MTAVVASLHRRLYVSELGYERAVCNECRTDWPCPTVAQARENVDGIPSTKTRPREMA